MESKQAYAKAVLLLCVFFSCACRSGHDVAGFDGAYRASKAIEAASHTGTDYTTFSNLVQAYATEVEVAKDSAKSDHAHKLLGLYSDGLSKYVDSRKFWSIANDCATHGYIDLRHQVFTADQSREKDLQALTDALAADGKNDELQPLVANYKITVYNGPGIETGVPSGININEALSTIWKAAEIPVDKANALYVSLIR